MTDRAIKIGVISDTHGVVLSGVHRAFRSVDRIIHAGDIDRPEVLMELDLIAPVTAVRGNMDAEEIFPHLSKQAVVSIGGMTALLIHDSSRLHNPPHLTSLIICGHTHRRMWQRLSEFLPSHLPAGCDPNGYVLNPGCGGTRSSEPTVAILSVKGKQIDAEFLRL